MRPDYSLLFALAAVGLVFGCQQGPAPARPAQAPSVSPAVVARGEGDQLMERGEHAKAAAKYQEAVALEPNDMALRFALGSAYTYLGKRAETIEQFQWVVKRGDQTADYYRSARQWLAREGLLPATAVASAGPDAASAARAQAATKGNVAGTLEWPGVNSRERLIKVRVTLTGDDPSTKSVNLSRPFRLGERYEFRDLAPGKYRLVAKAEDGAPAMELWEQTLSVEAGQVTQLPLGPANSKVSPDQFPGPQAKQQ
jgi:tetratricopeptide (TPR) repeat protein